VLCVVDRRVNPCARCNPGRSERPARADLDREAPGRACWLRLTRPVETRVTKDDVRPGGKACASDWEADVLIILGHDPARRRCREGGRARCQRDRTSRREQAHQSAQSARDTKQPAPVPPTVRAPVHLSDSALIGEAASPTVARRRRSSRFLHRSGSIRGEPSLTAGEGGAGRSGWLERRSTAGAIVERGPLIGSEWFLEAHEPPPIQHCPSGPHVGKLGCGGMRRYEGQPGR
jgi:hypothetical protein